MKKFFAMILVAASFLVVGLPCSSVEAGELEVHTKTNWGYHIEIDDTSLWRSNDGTTEFRGAWVKIYSPRNSLMDEGSMIVCGGGRGIWLEYQALKKFRYGDFYKSTNIPADLYSYIGNRV